MDITKYGMRLKSHLPITIDSIAVNKRRMDTEELFPGYYYITRPIKAYGPLWIRVYHAWLVLTNRAMAIQFSKDHFGMAPEEAARANPKRSKLYQIEETDQSRIKS